MPGGRWGVIPRWDGLTIRDIEVYGFPVPVSKKKKGAGRHDEGLRGRELGDIGLRGGAWAPFEECWIGGKWAEGGLMW